MRLSDSDRAEIVQQYQSGASSRQLAQDFGISKTSVMQIIKAAGVPVRYRSLSDDETSRAVRMYESGSTLTQIGQVLGFDPGTIRNELIRRGISRRCPHGLDSTHCYG